MVVDLGSRVILCEAKSGSTVTPRFFSGVRKLGAALEEKGLEVESRLVYGGTLRQSRGGAEVVPWNRVHEMGWAEKLSAMRTAEYFAERGAEADIEAARRLLRRSGGQPPDSSDRLE